MRGARGCRFPATVQRRPLADDQIAALAATGAVRPSVVSFENAAVRGPARLRGRQSAAIVANGAASLAGRDPFNARGAAGPPDIPLARLEGILGPMLDGRSVEARRTLLAHQRGAAAAGSWSMPVGYPEGAAGAQAAAGSTCRSCSPSTHVPRDALRRASHPARYRVAAFRRPGDRGQRDARR
jgi:hypothetical protein